MSRIINITTTDQLRKAVLEGDDVVLLYGAVSWCMPCRALKPKYTEASDKLEDVVFLYVDLDDENTAPELLDLHGVKGVPYMVKYTSHGFERIDTTTLKSAKDIIERLS